MGQISESLAKSLTSLIKPQTIFAFMIYSAVIYCAIWREVIPDILADAMFTLMGFYFGQKFAKKVKQ